MKNKLIELLNPILLMYRFDALENSDKIADLLITNGVTIQDKKEEHPMRYKNFEIRETHSQHSKYEVVRWFDTMHNGKPWCYVVAFIRWNPKEPCWVFESVGTRFIDDYENGLCEFISMFLEDKTPEEEA